MENIYEWLYDRYAEPKLRKLPEFRPELIQKILADIPEEQRLLWTDALCSLCLHWSTAAFELGVRTGISLAGGADGKYEN